MRLINYEEYKNKLLKVRDSIPLTVPAADVAPVVYCKDCKYADTERRNATEKKYFNSILFCRNSNLCGDEPLAMWPDDFCSYGERKDGGAE